MSTATHNLCFLIQHLKNQFHFQSVVYRQGVVYRVGKLDEATVRHLIRLVILSRKPFYRPFIQRFHEGNSGWIQWLMNDLFRMNEPLGRYRKVHPMWYRELYLFNQHRCPTRAFQPFDCRKVPLKLALTTHLLFEKEAQLSNLWMHIYDQVSEVWRHQTSEALSVNWSDILTMDCPSWMIAAMTQRSVAQIQRLRRELLGDTYPQTKSRDCGPQLHELKRNSRASFLLFKTTLIFQYCRSLGFNLIDAFYWAIHEVKSIPGFKGHVGERFWLEGNFFYWLVSHQLILLPSAFQNRFTPIEAFPEKFRKYFDSTSLVKMPDFSLTHVKFEETPFLPYEHQVFIQCLNERMAKSEPLLPVFLAFFEGYFQ